MDEVERAREAFLRRAWGEAYAALTGLDPDRIDPDDLERLAVAAYLVGEEHVSRDAWERAYAVHAMAADAEPAARCAVWMGVVLFLQGDTSQAGGWLARAEHQAADAPSGAAERFRLIAGNLRALLRGDMSTAKALGIEMIGLARRTGDADLLAWGLMCRGEADIGLGHAASGLQHLDEAMVAITTGELDPLPAGIVYCAAIDACMTAFDLRRAAEWTEALTSWCTAQPDLVPFQGQCLVHRAQLFQARGAWNDAAAEAARAAARLATPPSPALGLARYQQGELERLRGRFGLADEAYRDAAANGHDPAPGLALLRLAQGDLHGAAGVVRRMLAEHRSDRRRPVILGAAVDIFVATGDLESAAEACAQLATHSGAGAPVLVRALADHALGTLTLARGDAGAALAPLRQACRDFHQLELPYEAARCEVTIATACIALGDEESAELARSAARSTFARLGAGPDLATVDAGAARTQQTGALTAREREVIRLVASGLTNRQMAEQLMISPHTVGRHLQNIFAKLGLSSRAAATAYAYEHGLV